MRWHTWLSFALAFLASLGAIALASAPRTQPENADGLRALDGDWIYVEDRTEGKTLEQLGPPMSSMFTFRVEQDAIVLVWGHGGRRRDVRVALDGSITEIPDGAEGKVVRYRAEWKEGVLAYEIEFVSAPGQAPDTVIRREFRMSPDGLIVTFRGAVALYRHAEDIPMPTPAKAAIGDISWLAGAWTGTRGSQNQISIEERWSPPLGGAMLAVSRTVSRGKMSQFEYLRIVERETGLVYIAQPNGGTATEFVLTELSATRAVFENPRHDYPKRIAYELSPEGVLTATAGFTKGGTPQKFVFKTEAAAK